MYYTTEALRKIFELSIKEIEQVLDGTKKMSDMTRLAANSLTNFSKLRMTEIQERSLMLEERKFGRLLEDPKKQKNEVGKKGESKCIT